MRGTRRMVCRTPRSGAPRPGRQTLPRYDVGVFVGEVASPHQLAKLGVPVAEQLVEDSSRRRTDLADQAVAASSGPALNHTVSVPPVVAVPCSDGVKG